MMNITRNTGVALAVVSLLGASAVARADEGTNNWPQRASVQTPSIGPSVEKRAVARVDQTAYHPTGTNAGMPERAAEDAFYYRQFGGVSP